ncbi:MAG: DUF1446 domain-containing protein [Candidatus Marinimicrobia bacterium]|nr:DUF1446 domain-containing protein [Candidatus Neomarinimicrobiota bacterium]
MKTTVRIGNAQGFWGDSVDAPLNMVNGGPLDYLTLDYLAEVTLSIMQHQRQRDPGAGYARDFPEMLRQVLPVAREKGIRIVTNAAGVNAPACLVACRKVIGELGLSGIKIGIVSGDDLMDRLDEVLSGGAHLAHMENGASLETVRDKVLSANVYLDSFGMARALDEGADIVLTGRTTDPGLTLAPLIHEFGWKKDDWDLLAAGTVAGHILECGAQSTGGNFTRWQEVQDFENIGYPIAEVTPDGGITITKHDGTGGMVTVDTVSEQLLYELGQPDRYITPDVVADFTTIALAQAGRDRVSVSGIKGRPATDTFKVSVNYSKGWKATGQLTVSGPHAEAKAAKVAEIVFGRLEQAGFRYEETFHEIIGQVRGAPAGAAATERVDSLVLVLGVKDADKAKVDRFGKELAPVITNGPPGITGFAGGRPKAREVVAFWPALIDKGLVQSRVRVEEV